MLDFSEESIGNNCPNCTRDSDHFGYPLYETANFFVACDQHPLVAGHVLILPKQHLSCIAEYPDALHKDFLVEYDKIKAFVKQEFGAVSTFEHGKFGQSVFHSHVHLIPFSGEPEDIVPEGERHLSPIDDLLQLKDAFAKDGGYLFFSIGDRKWIVDPSLQMPRFFRDRVAVALNKSARGDWKKMHEDAATMAEARRENAYTQQKWHAFQN
jgi:diadenosine tetraphosphate (Ap4A) HIT family hydrolase